MLILYILGVLLSGLLVGALGRLIVPGPNPMSLGVTILVGVGGSVLGGFIGDILFDRPGGLLTAAPAAALIVWLLERRRGAQRTAHH